MRRGGSSCRAEDESRRCSTGWDGRATGRAADGGALSAGIRGDRRGTSPTRCRSPARTSSSATSRSGVNAVLAGGRPDTPGGAGLSGARAPRSSTATACWRRLLFFPVVVGNGPGGRAVWDELGTQRLGQGNRANATSAARCNCGDPHGGWEAGGVDREKGETMGSTRYVSRGRGRSPWEPLSVRGGAAADRRRDALLVPAPAVERSSTKLAGRRVGAATFAACRRVVATQAPVASTPCGVSPARARLGRVEWSRAGCSRSCRPASSFPVTS